MQQARVVPHQDVAVAPFVGIDVLVSNCVIEQGVEERAAIRLREAFDRDRVIGRQVDRALPRCFVLQDHVVGDGRGPAVDFGDFFGRRCLAAEILLHIGAHETGERVFGAVFADHPFAVHLSAQFVRQRFIGPRHIAEGSTRCTLRHLDTVENRPARRFRPEYQIGMPDEFVVAERANLHAVLIGKIRDIE